MSSQLQCTKHDGAGRIDFSLYQSLPAAMHCVTFWRENYSAVWYWRGIKEEAHFKVNWNIRPLLRHWAHFCQLVEL